MSQHGPAGRPSFDAIHCRVPNPPDTGGFPNSVAISPGKKTASQIGVRLGLGLKTTHLLTN